MAYLGVTLNLFMAGSSGTAGPEPSVDYESSLVKFYPAMLLALLCLVGL